MTQATTNPVPNQTTRLNFFIFESNSMYGHTNNNMTAAAGSTHNKQGGYTVAMAVAGTPSAGRLVGMNGTAFPPVVTCPLPPPPCFSLPSPSSILSTSSSVAASSAFPRDVGDSCFDRVYLDTDSLVAAFAQRVSQSAMRDEPGESCFEPLLAAL